MSTRPRERPARHQSPAHQETPAHHERPGEYTLRIVSWNLLHGAGATAGDVEALVRDRKPDLLLMQEATAGIDALPARIGGHYARVPLPGRRHGLACWSPRPFTHPPSSLPLPSGTFIHRVCQLVHGRTATGEDWSFANVHLSHGQMLNRRQLLAIAGHLPAHAGVLGDFNLVGPVMLPGFRDVGPRDPTHRMVDVVPLRIDRCLVRGFACVEAERLPRSRSDHHPIMVRLRMVSRDRGARSTIRERAESWALNALLKDPPLKDTEAAAASPHRADEPAGDARPASRA